MILFGFDIRRRRPARVTVQAELMSEEEINEALAVPETHPYHRALGQLLETARENAMIAAAEEPRERMGDYVGGARHLLMLRDDIAERREAEAKKKSKS